MSANGPTPRQTSGRIRDARGRRVTQLDPVALHLLRRHDVVAADALQAIANEKERAHRGPGTRRLGRRSVRRVARGQFLHARIDHRRHPRRAVSENGEFALVLLGSLDRLVRHQTETLRRGRSGDAQAPPLPTLRLRPAFAARRPGQRRHVLPRMRLCVGARCGGPFIDRCIRTPPATGISTTSPAPERPHCLTGAAGRPMPSGPVAQPVPTSDEEGISLCTPGPLSWRASYEKRTVSLWLAARFSLPCG